MCPAVGHVVPLVGIERHAQQQLPCGRTGGQVLLNDRGNCCRAGIVRAQRRHKARRVAPRTLKVIRHHANLVDRRSHPLPVDGRNAFRIGAACNGNGQAWPHRAQLSPKLRQQRIKVLRVRGIRVLPVHVDAIENTAHLHPGCQMPLDVLLHARPHKCHAMLGFRGLLKCCLLGLDRDHQSHSRIQRMQQLHLVQVAAQRRI